MAVPALPFDSSFGMVLTDPAGVARLKAVVDYPELRSVRIYENHTLLAQRTLPPTRNFSEVTFFLRLERGKIEAGLEGRTSVDAAAASAGNAQPWRLALTGSNMKPGQNITVSEINLTETESSVGGSTEAGHGG
jgi:hypothetical protein